MSDSTAVVRQFLLAAFDDHEIEALCFDHFPQVSREFTAGMSKSEKVQLLLDYCRRNNRGEALLTAIRELRPEQYAQQLGSVTARQINGVGPAAGVPSGAGSDRRSRLWLLAGGLGVAALAIAVLAVANPGGRSPAPPQAALASPMPTAAPATAAPTAAPTASPAPTPTPQPYQLTVQIWDVEADEKHQIIAAREFTATAPGWTSSEALRDAGAWITDQLSRTSGLQSEPVRGRLRVPADLQNERIAVEMNPAGAHQLYLYLVEATGKARVDLDPQTVASMGKDFYVELHRPGYQTLVEKVTWGQPLDTEFSLAPKKVAVGIDGFTGADNGIAIALATLLSSDDRLSVKDPATLATLRQRIIEEREVLAANPVAQTAIRTSLGVDYIITGYYDEP